jgi:hypothetical protein
MTYESDISSDVYDMLFDNTILCNFVDEYDRAYVDCSNACIYLLTSDNTKPQFKIKVERV